MIFVVFCIWLPSVNFFFFFQVYPCYCIYQYVIPFYCQIIFHFMILWQISKFLVHSKIRLSFCCWIVRILYIFWILDVYQISCKYFLPFCKLRVSLLLVYIEVQKFQILMKSGYLIFSLLLLVLLLSYFKNALPYPTSWRFTPTYICFVVLQLSLWSILS